MNYAYIRCSTNGQTTENQKIAIKKWAKYHRIHNIQWVSETTSGTKNPDKRKLGILINQASTYNANADYPRFPYDITKTQFNK